MENIIHVHDNKLNDYKDIWVKKNDAKLKFGNTNWLLDIQNSTMNKNPDNIINRFRFLFLQLLKINHKKTPIFYSSILLQELYDGYFFDRFSFLSAVMVSQNLRYL